MHKLNDFLEELRKPHVLVMLGKRQASMGKTFVHPYYALHPVARMPARVPSELVLAIARRESEFDPYVISPVGAWFDAGHAQNGQGNGGSRGLDTRRSV